MINVIMVGIGLAAWVAVVWWKTERKNHFDGDD